MNLADLERISNGIVYNFHPDEIDADELGDDERQSILTIIANLEETTGNLEAMLEAAKSST
jgi:hypothetical protein